MAVGTTGGSGTAGPPGRGRRRQGRPAGEGDGVHRRPAARAVPVGRGGRHARIGVEVCGSRSPGAAAHGQGSAFAVRDVQYN